MFYNLIICSCNQKSVLADCGDEWIKLQWIEVVIVRSPVNVF